MTARPLGGAVLIEGAAELRALLLSVIGTKKKFRLDGHPVGPQYDELEAAAREALSACGTTEFRSDPPAAASITDPIGTAEVAEILGCGARNVTRIAVSLGGHRVHRTWVFSRAEVLDYAEGRDEWQSQHPKRSKSISPASMTKSSTHSPARHAIGPAA